jgi:hypothetical protein
MAHIISASRPLGRREAWIWLLSAATWKARTVFVDGRRVALLRGQAAHSIRFMAEAWGWPKSNISRFLDALKTETMIETQSGTGITIITICNYDKYQRVSLPDRDTDGTPTGTKVGHERDKEEDREYRKEDLVLFPVVEKPTPKPSGMDPSFGQFYSAYPRRQSKQDAIKAYAQVRKAGVSHEAIMRGLERAKRSDSRFREQRFTPLPASWLRAGGFEDDTAAPQEDWKKAAYL